LVVQVFDDRVERFLDGVKPGTRKVYRHGLAVFEEFYGGSVIDFLKSVEEDMRRSALEKTHVARTTLSSFVKWLEEKGYPANTVRAYTASVQSLAKYYEIPISLRYVKLPPAKPVNRKHPWTIEEIGKFVKCLRKPVYQSIAASIVQSGLSLSDLLGLTYSDIKTEFEKDVTPLCLDLTRKKTGVSFMTFLGEWAVKLLRQHLADKKLHPNDPIYNVKKRAVEATFQRAGRKFGNYQGRNPYSPHSLRAAFNTILRDHKVDPLYVEYWMGHKIPEQQLAYITKSRESWRQTYREQAEPWLTPPNIKR